LITGAGEGTMQEPFHLQAGEVLVQLRGRQGGLLDGVQFVTSLGRESRHYGGRGGDPFEVRAAEGKMIVGLERSPGIAGKVTGVQVCDIADRRSPEEKGRDTAKAGYEEALRTQRRMEQEARDLESKLGTDLTDARAAYRLFDACAEGHANGYGYKICLFGSATQDGVSLGKWEKWDAAARHTAVFANGERCFSGITRSLRLALQCGEDVGILGIREPSQCVYEASMTHPAACEAASVESGARAKPRYPHESHDEL